MSFRVVIPARHGATRLPGKPLREIAGRSMIHHVYQRAVESGADEVVVATDHRAVVDACSGFGATACLTDTDHRSGTDRVAEVAEHYGWPDDAIVVNLQGDEPTMPAENIARVADNLAAHADAEIASLCTPVGTIDEMITPDVVKVVRDARDFALLFSRAPVPWNRDGGFQVDAGMPPGGVWFRHIGLYAYRVASLKAFTAYEPCELESKEMLEQLRAQWYGMRIHVGEALALPGIGVDTEADLERVEQLLTADDEHS